MGQEGRFTGKNYNYEKHVASPYPPNQVWPCYYSLSTFLCLLLELHLEDQTHELLEANESVGQDGVIKTLPKLTPSILKEIFNEKCFYLHCFQIKRDPNKSLHIGVGRNCISFVSNLRYFISDIFWMIMRQGTLGLYIYQVSTI